MLLAAPIIENICSENEYSGTIGNYDNASFLTNAFGEEKLRDVLGLYLVVKNLELPGKLRYSITDAIDEVIKGDVKDQIKLYSVKRNDGKPLIQNFGAFQKLYGSSIDPDILESLVKLKGNSKRDFFAQKTSFEDSGLEKEELKSEVLSTDKYMNKFWPAIKFAELGGDLSMAISYRDCERADGIHPIDGDFAYRLLQLGYTPDTLDTETCMPEFVDTDKPNSVIAFGRDWNGAFDNEKIIDFFGSLGTEYDRAVLFTENRDEILDLTKNIENDELLITPMHGSRYLMSLVDDPRKSKLFRSKKLGNLRRAFGDFLREIGIKNNIGAIDPKTYIGIPNARNLDEDSAFMRELFASLDPKATVFYMSCDTASGENYFEKGHSLAGTTTKLYLGEEQRLIASESPFNADNLKVYGLYPFDVDIIRDGEDKTFNQFGNK